MTDSVTYIDIDYIDGWGPFDLCIQCKSKVDGLKFTNKFKM